MIKNIICSIFDHQWRSVQENSIKIGKTTLHYDICERCDVAQIPKLSLTTDEGRHIRGNFFFKNHANN